jgi:hypothetical protein
MEKAESRDEPEIEQDAPDQAAVEENPGPPDPGADPRKGHISLDPDEKRECREHSEEQDANRNKKLGYFLHGERFSALIIR